MLTGPPPETPQDYLRIIFQQLHSIDERFMLFQTELREITECLDLQSQRISDLQTKTAIYNGLAQQVKDHDEKLSTLYLWQAGVVPKLAAIIGFSTVVLASVIAALVNQVLKVMLP